MAESDKTPFEREQDIKQVTQAVFTPPSEPDTTRAMAEHLPVVGLLARAINKIDQEASSLNPRLSNIEWAPKTRAQANELALQVALLPIEAAGVIEAFGPTGVAAQFDAKSAEFVANSMPKSFASKGWKATVDGWELHRGGGMVMHDFEFAKGGQGFSLSFIEFEPASIQSVVVREGLNVPRWAIAEAMTAAEAVARTVPPAPDQTLFTSAPSGADPSYRGHQ